VIRFRKSSRLAVGAVLALGMAGAAIPALAGPAAAAGPQHLTGTLPDGAKYVIDVPASWNGTLFLYSHGYVTPGAANPATDAGDPATAAEMLKEGYALAGSSYAKTGWAIQEALPDQIATLDQFDSQVGQPSRVVAWGHSLGGIITAGLIQQFPGRFTAALPMCGVLSGGVGTWNTALDSAFAFQQLIDPSVQVVNITVDPKNPTANLQNAIGAATAAQATPAGRARLALAAALGDVPGWFTPLSPEPAASDFTGQEANQFQWDTQVDFPFAFLFRAELEGRAGGNPSWNTGVNYSAQLFNSSDYREVLALYRAAHLNLNADLNTLRHAQRIAAKPSAVSYLVNNITFNGKLSIPVLTMHTTGDGLVVPQNEQAYQAAVSRAGDSALLRQIFVHRAGHCAFTPAVTITAVHELINRLNTGSWSATLNSPAALNTEAGNLGAGLNIFASGGQVVPVPPAFIAYRPTVYPRPFNRPPFG
jgi:dienelactone hydrolase